MAVDTNGQLKGANASSYANGKANGKMNGHMNGKPVSRRRAAAKQRGFFAALFSMVARLSTWVAILTVLFRCPSTLEACDETSPFICKPYFQAKNAILPHATPYYGRYAAPYVEVARPYYNSVDQSVLTPGRKYAVQYGGPWAEKAQGYALAQWQENGEPRVAQLREISHAQYQKSVAPLLEQANDVLGPYYSIARTNGLQAYYEYLLPGYKYVQPYALQGYNAASDFTANSALPAAYWTWNKTYIFLDTAVWPQIRVLYVENVEPQLVRIGERLGRYKNKSNQVAADIVTESETAKESVSSVVGKVSSQVSSYASSSEAEQPAATETVAAEEHHIEYDNPVQAPPAAANESEKRKKAREMVAHDLEMWQNKFAAAADEGALDMEERVSEIAQRFIADDLEKNGKPAAAELKSAVESQIDLLKQKIREIVAANDKDDVDAEEKVTLAVRTAGVNIKEKAQALRAWRENFDESLQKTVVEAAEHHFQILDDTRALALQKIGMNWAWTDGVTYKDWAKFHELKATLSQWTDELKQLIVTNPALVNAQDAAAQVEDDAMDVAGSAAGELVRLKEVAHYKIVAQDATENFAKEALMAAAEAALAAKQAEKAAAKSASAAASEASIAAARASEAAANSAKEAASSASSVVDVGASSAASAADQASEALADQSTAASQSAASILSEGDDAVSDAGEELSNTVSGAASSVSSYAEEIVANASAALEDDVESVKSVAKDATDTAKDFTVAAAQSAHSVVDAAEEVASEAAESVSSLVDDTQSTASEAASSLSEDASSEGSEAKSAAAAFASDASEAIVGQTQSIVSNSTNEQVEQKVPEVDEDELPIDVEEDPLAARDETPPDAQAPPVKPAFLGAAAQAVPERKPILEDYVDTDAVESITNAAASAYSSAISRASEQYASAASVVSAQIYGTPKPVHEQLLASVSSAYDFALAAASTKYDQAMGTPTPTSNPAMVDWKKVEDIAAQRLNEGRLWAELQYQSAVIALGLATPTPSSSSEKYLEQAKRNYYAGIGIAQDRYSSFLDAASSIMTSMTATPTPTNIVGTASSAMSAARESAESVARLAEEAVESAYSAAGEKVASVANAVDDSIAGVVEGVTEQAYLAGAAIAETWDNAIAQISGQVYGEQKHLGWYDSLLEEAGSYVSSATKAVADGASAATEKAGDTAGTASAEASKQYDAVSELISELIHGKEPTFSESVLSRLSAAYATASAGFESYASEASAAASSVSEKVGSAASQATEAVKEKVERGKDEL